MNATGITRTKIGDIVKTIKPIFLTLLLASLLGGCATKSTSMGPVFFPPPPDEPHVQFLTGITNSEDFGQASGGLSKFITGGTKAVTKLIKPFGLTIHKGVLYVCDISAGQVVRIDFANKTMKSITPEVGSGRLNKPVGVAVDDDGNIYVADNGRKDIAVYDASGKYIKSYGKEFEHINITAVAVHDKYLFALDNRAGKLFVLDRENGEVITKLGEDPDNSKNFSIPNGFNVDPKGIIYVVNMGNGKIKKYDRDGNFLEQFGGSGDVPGKFARPRGIAIDDEGLMFVVDAGNGVVQVFNEKNHILGSFGEPGLGAGSLNLPAGVAVSKDNLELFQKYAAPGFKLHEVIFVTNQFISPITPGLSIYGLGEMEGTKKESADKKSTIKSSADKKSDSK
jgi:sugar lactone lactonase YvrE